MVSLMAQIEPIPAQPDGDGFAPYLKSLVRTVPDFPKPGILFYDITTLLKDRRGLAELIDGIAAHYIAGACGWSMTCWPREAPWKPP